MQYFVLEPEVAGGWGRNTRTNSQNHRPTVEQLHYEFTDWLGDALLESTPCFIVTEALAESIESAGLSGYEFAEVEVSTAYPFEEMHPGLTLPPFRRLIPTGTPGVDDFAMSASFCLVVSSRAKEVIDGFQMTNCDASAWMP